jgi:cytochrome oxidase Cu insertion factor (SCO1/SenC/PrrC family)
MIRSVIGSTATNQRDLSSGWWLVAGGELGCVVRSIPSQRNDGFLRRARPLGVIFALILAACHHESTLPRLFPVPDAPLVSESGKAVRLAEMKGYVTVYDFIFTNCAGTCPMMTATLRRITSKVDKGAKVRFVSISVDPKRDTPAVLHEYAVRVRNDPRWLFLTGEQKTIVDLSVNGFKLAAGGDTGSPNESILHSAKFAIADQNGVIRDYYGAENDDAVDHVVKVVHDLL